MERPPIVHAASRINFRETRRRDRRRRLFRRAVRVLLAGLWAAAVLLAFTVALLLADHFRR